MKSLHVSLAVLILNLPLLGQDINELQKSLRGQLPTKERIENLNLLSRALTFVNPNDALRYANEALRLSIQTSDSTGLGYAYRNLAGIYAFDKRPFIGMEYLQRALDIFEARKDSIGIGNCYISLGHTYRQLENRKEEVAYHKKSYEIFSRQKLSERIGVSAHNLGESYFNSGDLKAGRRLTLKAISINDSLHNLSVLSASYKVLGLIDLAESNLDKAEKSFLKTITISNVLQENSQKNAAFEAILQMAQISKLRGDQIQQHKYLLQAAQFSKNNNMFDQMQRAQRELIQYALSQNDLALVRAYINDFPTVTDSVLQSRQIDQYNLIQTLIQAHELSQTKIKLENQALMQAREIQTQNIILWIVGVSASFLLVFIILLNRSRNQIKKINKTIEEQRQVLALLNQTKDKFFSIVAHDLKSPLNSLHSFSTLLADNFDKFSKDEIIKMSKELRLSVNNTTKLADNLITWAKVQMHSASANPQVIPVEKILTSIEPVYKEIANQKKITCSCNLESGLHICADADQVEFIVRNLVNNAIKFTDVGGQVDLNAVLQESEVLISVSDNGIGMNDDQLKNLFTIGNKNNRRGTSGETGTGLGLMLCQDFVKLNRGRLTVESKVGKGSVFRVFLPTEAG